VGNVVSVDDVVSVTNDDAMQSAPCGLRGCKNGPSPFPGRMSYKATKPGFVCLSYLSMLYYCISNSSSSSSSRFVERITRTGESLMSI